MAERDGRGAGDAPLFDTRLSPAARLAAGVAVNGLVDHLAAQQPGRLRWAVSEEMTLTETSFFRDVRPFEALRKTILPRLLRARMEERRLRIWCGGCSTGQEVYSLAMLLLDWFPELGGWDIRILGTDASREVLAHARAGLYRRAEVNRGLPARLLIRYFTRVGEDWQISDEIRSLCAFRQASLSAAGDMSWKDVEQFDLVLLRNVLLYFSQHDRAAVLRGVHRSLAQDGLLLLGDAEQAEDSSDLFEVEVVGESYFYRPSRAWGGGTPLPPESLKVRETKDLSLDQDYEVNSSYTKV